MRILQINGVPYGSTGKIMFGLSDLLQTGKYMVSCNTSFTWVKSHRDDDAVISGFLEKSAHIVLGRLTGFHGCFSVYGTARLLHRIKTFRPDIIHLHNLHGWFLNHPLLFSFIKFHNIPVIWTLHDCWAFTGQCPHFTLVKCDKWKTGCHHCPQYREYPQSYVDQTRLMWKLKKKWFTGVDDLTIVTPSQWLADLVKESFLRDYPVQVIHNGIDLDVFKPTDSSFRKRYGCENKKVILGVAFDWGVRKGLDVFIELAKRLDETYQIVLVGTNERIDQVLPDGIVSIHRTHDQAELAQIYSAADLFVNPTREENYPTVNMEALACGTPVLTFRTGGSPEILDETCGCIVDCDDVDGLEREIIRICEEKPFSKEDCLKRAKCFDMQERFQEYLRLYEEKHEQQSN